MESQYCRIDVQPKRGNEPFVLGERDLGFDLLSFWRWSGSDLVGNTMRGILAEYIVAKALKIECKVRTEWDAFDLVTEDGLRIEVKSSSYLQSWEQKSLSKIIFGIQQTRGWDASTNSVSSELRRQAHLYVFCVLAYQEQETLNPLNVDQWEFYVVPTSTLDRECVMQRTIGLSRLKSIAGASVSYDELSRAVSELAVAISHAG